MWRDDDADGVVDENEDGIEGVVVTLTRDGEQVATTTTDADGAYRFEDLPPGDYVVEIDETTFPDGLRVVSSPGDGASMTASVELTLDEDVATIDFGLDSPPSALALTGSSVYDQMIFGALLFLAGVVLVAMSRRPRRVELVLTDLADDRVRSR